MEGPKYEMVQLNVGDADKHTEFHERLEGGET